MFRKQRKNVGVLGLGIIGSRVAENLRKRGYTVFVWSRSPKMEPNFLGSAAEVAGCCETIQIFVSDGPALQSCMAALAPALGKRHLILSHPTVGPVETREAAATAAAAGAEFLDAPFTGSKQAAEDGQLVYYIGGSEAVLERARPVLEASSKAILMAGKIGDASTLKLATNMVNAAIVQVLAEGLALCTRGGLPPATFAEAVAAGASRSGISDLKMPSILRGDYEPHFALRHMAKDLRFALETAMQTGAELPVTRVVSRLLAECMERGMSDLDFSALAKAGVEAHASPQSPQSPESLADREKQ